MPFAIARGTWISFQAQADQIVGCLPLPGAKRFCGQVTATAETTPFGPGAIPSCFVTVKGRTGATMTFDFVQRHGQIHENQAEAIASLSKCHG